ncbi:hypothetical protein ACFRAO_35375 [Streptomyces sp. NPDC056656]|uniref:hypothetical protein n=1 Tax=Streptomyces sp. NPDC056656 TaxID=3345895 RepID=UPI0036BBA797
MTPRAVPRTAVVAIGGNALLRGGTHAAVAEQVEAARRLASPVVALADTGWGVVVTHGNGPQAGFVKRRADLAAALAPELPALDLDMCVADSQGGLGYILTTAIAGRLRSLGRDLTAQLGAALDGRGGTWLDSEPARTTEEPLNGTVTAGRPQ